MARGFPQTVKDHLEKCRAAALAAVDAYNRPGPRFRTAQYVVMITIAWTAAFHAAFYKRGRRPWYRRTGTGTGIRYVKIDKEPKHWELSECLAQHFGGSNPSDRKNLEFLIGLRNKIEHRHLPDLDASLYGECQAALLNLEEFLATTFGRRYALTDQLVVALQFSQVIPSEKKQAARALARSEAKSVTEYVEKFRGGLPSTVLNSMKYSFNVFLVPKVANRQSVADAAVQFVRVDEASPEELERLGRLNVLIREKHIPIANLDLYKPSQVVALVCERLTSPFTMSVHTLAWKHYGVRPRHGDAHPERTEAQYCVFDKAHRDYLYTQAWVDLLARELADPARYASVVGQVGAGLSAAQPAAAADQAPHVLNSTSRLSAAPGS
jgi:hypothetical protein